MSTTGPDGARDRPRASGKAAEPSGLEALEIPVGGALWRRTPGQGLLRTGLVLAAVHGVIVFGGGFWVGALYDADVQSTSRPRLVGAVMLVSTVTLPLVALSLILVGDHMRRGLYGRSAQGDRSHGVLPHGTNTVELRMIGIGWHVSWIGVTAVVVVVLSTMIASRGRWSWADGSYEKVFTLWVVNGLIAAGGLGATVASLVKRLVFERRGPATGPQVVQEVVHPALRRRLGEPKQPGSAFWRWFGYRWRLDLWVSALGAIVAWVGGLTLMLRVHFEGDAASMTQAAQALIGVGLALFVGGLLATTQFYRAGEDLASGESVS